MTHPLRTIALSALVALSLHARTQAGEVPAEVAGKWVAGTSGGINYWDNGTFLGSNRGSGQYYEFKPDGSFVYCMVMELRSGYVVTRVRTESKGTVKFAAGKFTLSVTSGHYHSEVGTTIKDRDMTEADCQKMSKTYDWTMAPGHDGRPHFIVPFDDGSKFDFEPAVPSPKDKE